MYQTPRILHNQYHRAGGLETDAKLRAHPKLVQSRLRRRRLNLA